MSSKRARWLSAWLPVVLCILLISVESTPTFGADHTTGPLQRLLEYLTGRHFTQPEWWRLHILIRKCGHFLGYGLQSLAWFRAFWMTWWPGDLRDQRRLATHLLAMLGTYLIAVTDELHQTFLSNRSGSIWDVLIDSSGALLLQIVLFLWMSRREARG